MFKNANGALFGIGTQANKPWWVDIKVSGPTVTPGGPTRTPTANCHTWRTNCRHRSPALPMTSLPMPVQRHGSAARCITCPGTDGDAKGFVLKVSNPKLETGATDTRAGHSHVPTKYSERIYSGLLSARSECKAVTASARPSTVKAVPPIVMLHSASIIRRAMIRSGPSGVHSLRDMKVRFYRVDVDLSSLAGKDVKFILTVLAAGVATGDRAMWVGPHIYRVGASP